MSTNETEPQAASQPEDDKQFWAGQWVADKSTGIEPPDAPRPYRSADAYAMAACRTLQGLQLRNRMVIGFTFAVAEPRQNTQRDYDDAYTDAEFGLFLHFGFPPSHDQDPARTKIGSLKLDSTTPGNSSISLPCYPVRLETARFHFL